MKRRFGCLALVLALLAGLMLPALAAGAEPSVTVTAEADGSYTVRYEAGERSAGARFSLLVIQKGADAANLADGDILYAAQSAADGAGMVEFSGVRPKVSRSARFLVSGGGLTRPVEGAVEVPGTVVVGNVSLYGSEDCSGAAITFTRTDGEEEPYVVRSRYDGSFVTDALSPGTYGVKAEADGYQPCALSEVSIAGEDFTVTAAMVLYSGDVDGNGTIDHVDAEALLADFGKTDRLTHAGCDVNQDGFVNGRDLSLLAERIYPPPEQTLTVTPALTGELVKQNERGGYTLSLRTEVEQTPPAAPKRLEFMLSWDPALLTLADGKDGFAPLALKDGDNQSAFSGAVSAPAGSFLGAVYFRGENRDACYLTVAAGRLGGVDAALSFRLAEGKTEADFYKGALRVESADSEKDLLARILPVGSRSGALLGFGGTVNRSYPDGGLEVALRYPNMDRQIRAGLGIYAPHDVLGVPAKGQPAASLQLTAVSVDLEGDEMPAPDTLTWTLASAPEGVALTQDNCLTAAAGTTRTGDALVKVGGDGFTAEKTVRVSQGMPEPFSVVVKRDGVILDGAVQLSSPRAGNREYVFTAAILDQYDEELETPKDEEGKSAISWRVTPSGEEVRVDGSGKLTVAAGAAGSYTLTAAFDRLECSLAVTVTAESGGGSGGGVPTMPEKPGVTLSDGEDGITVKVEPVRNADGAYSAVIEKSAAAEILKAIADKTGGVTVTVPVAEEGARIALSLDETLTAGLRKAGIGLTLALPVLGEAAAGLTAMQVNTGGTLEPVRKSALVNGTMMVPLSGSAVIEVRDNSKTFTDVDGNWAAESVNFVSARELLSGADGMFFPTGEVDRGMIATVLYRLEGESAPAADGPAFSDVPRGAWYAAGAAWAAQTGVAGGKGGGVFDPGAPVTREELAVMLYRLAAPKPSEDPPVEQHRFTDGGEISTWAREAVEWCVSAGLLTGRSGGRLDPRGTATRAEAAVLLERFVKLSYGEEGAV